MKDLIRKWRFARKFHFKPDTKKFCFDNLVELCPVTGKKFHVHRVFLEEHSSWHRVPADCFCSECLNFLYKERRKKDERGNSAFFGKIF